MPAERCTQVLDSNIILCAGFGTGNKGVFRPFAKIQRCRGGGRTMAAFPELCDELAIADRDVTEGQELIARQAEVVCELRTEGHDTRGAQNLLGVMHQRLDAVTAQRQQIVRELASIQGEEL